MQTHLDIHQATILGVGLLGGSVALAMRAAWPACKIVGWGPRSDSLDRAMKMGAIDRFDLDAAAACDGSDLVILCTPVGAFESTLKAIAPKLQRGCLVTDVGSTKRAVAFASERTLPGHVEFVASHPIAGSEKRGVEYARGDLLRGALCILTPTDRTPPAATVKVEGFWQKLGMRTIRMTPIEHDLRLAEVSHLPHLVAAVLMEMQSPASLPLCGKGFLDTTRIAAGDAGLWRDIFLDNADNLRSGIGRFIEELSTFSSLLDPAKSQELHDWLKSAADRRTQLGEQRQEPPR